MNTLDPRLRRSVSVCPQPGCGGKSQVEETSRYDTWYIRRSRACVKCGTTWGTAEVPLVMVKRLMRLDAFLQEMQDKIKD